MGMSIEECRQIPLQLDYLGKAFRLSILALEDICKHQELIGELGEEHRLANKALGKELMEEV